MALDFGHYLLIGGNRAIGIHDDAVLSRQRGVAKWHGRIEYADRGGVSGNREIADPGIRCHEQTRLGDKFGQFIEG